MLMVIGNAVPKVIGPLEGRCSPAKWQSEQRFSGWVFTLAGLAYTTLWVFAPVAHAADASMLACAAALVLVLARLAWRVFKS